jgi:FkbM family methyltransferase
MCDLEDLDVVPLRLPKSRFGIIRMALPMVAGGRQDAVSHQLRASGFWEFSAVEEVVASRSGLHFAPRGSAPPTFLDLGANLGFYSILFAAEGWSVFSVEAMAHNRRALRASLCLNPSLNVTLIPAALGSAAASRAGVPCIATTIERNRGNGRLTCGPAAAALNCSALVHSGVCHETRRGRTKVDAKCAGGSYDIAVCERVRLAAVDEVLNDAHVGAVDALKLDVEGMECDILDGARRLLSDPLRRPRFLQVEAALINPLMPRLGSRSEACAWSMARTHAFGGCKGSSRSTPEGGTLQHGHQREHLYTDRTLFLYQRADPNHTSTSRRPFWAGGPGMPRERAPAC